MIEKYLDFKSNCQIQLSNVSNVSNVKVYSIQLSPLLLLSLDALQQIFLSNLSQLPCNRFFCPFNQKIRIFFCCYQTFKVGVMIRLMINIDHTC